MPVAKKKLTIRKWLKANRERFKTGEKLKAACIKALKTNDACVRKVMREEWPGLLVDHRRGKNYGTAMPKIASTNGKKRPGLSRGAFQSQFDDETVVREAIRKALAKITDDAIIPEAVFKRDYCQVSSGRWTAISGEAEFSEYQFRCANKTWWTTKDTVKWALQNVRKAREV